MKTSATFAYTFPAIRGVQAGREYYVSMCPLKIIPKLFHFDNGNLGPELRAQRILNKNRIPALTNYIIENKDNYIFSALTVSVDGPLDFTPIDPETNGGIGFRLGSLNISMDANFIINDGQHRKAAIEEALKSAPELENETIAVVFFVDRGLKRCQQMFADLNRYAIRPSASISVLFDARDQIGRLAKLVALTNTTFQDRVELEKSSIAPRSRKLFTLSAINYATRELVAGFHGNTEEVQQLVLDYWDEVATNIPEWQMLKTGGLSAGELREKYVHGHSVLLQALGRLGHALLSYHEDDWRIKIRRLNSIDWLRANRTDWEGRAMLGGRMSKNMMNVALTTNKLKLLLGLPLSESELETEKKFKRAPHD